MCRLFPWDQKDSFCKPAIRRHLDQKAESHSLFFSVSQARREATAILLWERHSPQ